MAGIQSMCIKKWNCLSFTGPGTDGPPCISKCPMADKKWSAPARETQFKLSISS